jgi:hypoxanthine phosphoribosyltransferase
VLGVAEGEFPGLLMSRIRQMRGASREFADQLKRAAEARAAGLRGVITFNSASFDEACRELVCRVCAAEGQPDVLIGIPTGGLWVAEAMARQLPERVPVLSLTYRRPSTRRKQRVLQVLRLLRYLPRVVIDGLRMLEKSFLGILPRRQVGTYQFDARELADIAAWLVRAGARPYLLVVDDAVDSGVTLMVVLQELRRVAPPGALIRAATVTVTTAAPAVRPHYNLYDGRLCRFPWSLDA